MSLFVNLLFGHLVGDFLFQPKSMAVKKGASNWVAVTHVAIYTFFLCLFTSFHWKWVLFVYVSHFIIDRWSLADKWLQLIKGRDLPDFVIKGHQDIPEDMVGAANLNYRILRGSFHAIVYTVVDFTLHMVPMYYAFPYLQ